MNQPQGAGEPRAEAESDLTDVHRANNQRWNAFYEAYQKDSRVRESEA